MSATETIQITKTVQKVPNIRSFNIHLSSLLKSSVLNRRKRLSVSGHLCDQRMRLQADTIRFKRIQHLRRLSLRRIVAEEKLSVKQLKETAILASMVDQGTTFTTLDPNTALTLANATEELLVAEATSIKLQVQEVHQLLETLIDSFDEAQARVCDAGFQVSTILERIDSEHLTVDQKLKSQITTRPEAQLTLDFDLPLVVRRDEYPTTPGSVADIIEDDFDFDEEEDDI